MEHQALLTDRFIAAGLEGGDPSALQGAGAARRLHALLGLERAVAHRRPRLRALRLRDGHAHLRRRLHHRHDQRCATRATTARKLGTAALRLALLAELSQRELRAPAARSTRPSRSATRTSSTATACRCAPWSACAPTRSCRSSTTCRCWSPRSTRTQAGVQGRFDAQGVSFANAQRLARHYLDAYRESAGREPRRLGGAASALLEVLDRDGQVRQAWPIERWPVRRPRARQRRRARPIRTSRRTTPRSTSSPAATAAPACSSSAPATPATASPSAAAHRRRRARSASPTAAATSTCTSAATHLRLRLPGHALAPELPLARGRSAREHPLAADARARPRRARRVLFSTWLDTDPDSLAARRRHRARWRRSPAARVVRPAGRCCRRSSRRQSHFGWHVRVLLIAAWCCSTSSARAAAARVLAVVALGHRLRLRRRLRDRSRRRSTSTCWPSSRRRRG